MSLAFARRRQAEAKKRAEHGKAVESPTEKKAVVDLEQKDEKRAEQSLDAGPKQKGKSKKAQKDSARV
jgi:hypothetical protein